MRSTLFELIGIGQKIFANYFSTVANSIDHPDEIDISKIDFLHATIEKHRNCNNIKSIIEWHRCNVTFEFKQVDIEYVYKLLSKLNIYKATGYDNVPPKMVKICAEELSVTLTELVNYAFKKNWFSDDMKRAEISLFKKKHYDILKDNYRPTSILSIFSKLFETILVDQLMEYFKSIFNDMLCAYRKKYGTEHIYSSNS